MIGMKQDGAIALVTFDVIVSIVMTSLFIWPLLRAHFHNSDLKHIARRSVIAASIALSTSCVNITVLAVMHGVELGWVCLACWEADVMDSMEELYNGDASGSNPKLQDVNLKESRKTEM
ncbi:hypothetical protein PHLCEN_2v13319 [Hermanssonia centrifuga]|uniref:Uncharacterized protein n=1 Tax=Hermanssonia centrifuga TaxID=98765 RepID=A0A2R6NEI1_9APHY|nr:hypothetical protein PHLCEN_2v13319 [Hermanssonia centrifuga]